MMLICVQSTLPLALLLHAPFPVPDPPCYKVSQQHLLPTVQLAVRAVLGLCHAS
jgi:hypothetical protein